MVAKLTLLELMSFLEPLERRLTLRLCLGFKLREIAVQEGLTHRAVRACLAGVRSKVETALHSAIG